MNAYFSNGGGAIGRLTKDAVERKSSNTEQKFAYVTLACPRGYNGDSNFVDFIMQGSTNDGRTFNNNRVESFCRDVKKGFRVYVEYHIESYLRDDNGVNKNTMKLVIDEYRILDRPNSNVDDTVDQRPRDDDQSSMPDPLDGI